MYRPETPNKTNFSNAPDDGSSIFAGKKETDIELLPHQRAEEYPVDIVGSLNKDGIPQGVLHATRLVLTLQPELLQDDVAKLLNISLFSLEKRTTPPELIKIQGKSLEVLASTHLGRLVLERRNYRIKNIENLIKSRQKARREEESAEKERVRIEANKKIRKTKNMKRASRHSAARRRGKLKAMALENEVKERSKTLMQKREKLITSDREKRLHLYVSLKNSFNKEEIELLHLLDKSDDEISKITGMTANMTSKAVARLRAKADVDSRPKLALFAFEHEVPYNIKSVPSVSEFTLRERQVASLLEYTDKEMSKKLRITQAQLSLDIISIRKKIGPVSSPSKNASRIQYMLAAKYYHLQPFEEELDNPHSALAGLTKPQQETVKLLNMSTSLIGSELGISKRSVQARLKIARDVKQVESNMQLALKLKSEGLEFQIKKPKGKVHEVLSRTELAIARLGEYSNQEIANRLGLTDDQVVHEMSDAKGKLRARNRIELVMMMQAFDTGEVPPEDNRTRLESFFDIIDIPPMSKEKTQKMMDVFVKSRLLTQLQRERIEAYFLNENRVTWAEIGQPQYMAGGSVRSSAYQGIEKMQKAIEEERTKREKGLN